MSRGEKIFVTVNSIFAITELLLSNYKIGAIAAFTSIMSILIGIEEQV